MAFNLIDQPWILVQPAEGAQQEVSLRQIFSEGSSIRRITGEVPTQGFALLRLLLAICHDAVGWHTTDAIEQLHEDGLDLAAIDAYLDEWHARFDLLDPQRPFFQVAGLATANGEHSGLEKIIADVPNGQPFFTTRAGRGLAQISLAEAARWLIHVQAFDPSGIRSGAVGDALAKNGKGYPIGPAWSGHLGGIVQHGDSLLQTLLLNITETPKNPADRPVWTWPNAPTAVRAEEAIPAGPVQLLVWQSRRVRLVSDPDASAIIGVVLSQGDKLTPQNRHQLEPMSGWRYSAPQTKKFRATTYMPNKHDASRAFWRGLPAVLTPGAGLVEDSFGKHDRFRAPQTLETVADFEGRITLQAVGITYGAQEATIEEIIDDPVELDASMFDSEAASVRAVIADSVGNADVCVRHLGNLAANLARAAGEKGDSAGDGARKRAMEEAWSELDRPARRWIAGLTADSDPETAQREWQHTIRRVVLTLGQALTVTAPSAAVRGRDTSHGFMNAAQAERRFRSEISKELSLTRKTKEDTTP